MNDSTLLTLSQWALTAMWAFFVIFLLLHLTVKWWKTAYGVNTMLTTLSYNALLGWICIWTWLDKSPLDYPVVRLAFWAGGGIFAAYRLGLFIWSQTHRSGPVFEEKIPLPWSHRRTEDDLRGGV